MKKQFEKSNNKNLSSVESIHSITVTALLAAALCASSFFVIPLPFTPVVLSLQTVIVNLISFMLKPLKSFCCVGIYILMGVFGMPVFSSGTSGLGKLLGPTGGFYFGFLLSAVLISALKGKGLSFKRYLTVSLFVGIPIQHLCAVAFMCFHNGFDISSAIATVSLPFVLGDILKCIASCLIAIPVIKNSKLIL